MMDDTIPIASTPGTIDHVVTMLYCSLDATVKSFSVGIIVNLYGCKGDMFHVSAYISIVQLLDRCRM